MNNALRAPSSLLALLLLFTGCRPPQIEQVGDDPGVFDAGTETTPTGSACPADPSYAFNNSFSPYLGTPDEPEITVVNFSNFGCPHCAHLAERIDELLDRREDLRPRVRFYFHHFMFTVGGSAEIHASAAAAGYQGQPSFWAVHDFIYEKMLGVGGMPTADAVERYARNNLDLDIDRFREDRDSDATLSYLWWDRTQGKAAGVLGTPTVYVCGEPVLPYLIESAIDYYLEEAAADGGVDSGGD